MTTQTHRTRMRLRINGDRLNHSLNELAQIGAQAGNAVRRLAFSPEDVAAREQVAQWMREADMTVRIDPVGNLIGTYSGLDTNAPALATGSHIDTVPSGGRYDGTLGVLAGIEIARVLQENQIQLHHPFEVIVFADEEHTMIGSKAIAGVAPTEPERYAPPGQVSIQDCLTHLGGDWTRLAEARRDRSNIACFLELHVEQGGVLEAADRQIGVVEGIVGQRRFQIKVQGQANHAGTTPMPVRRDALTASARLILALEDIARQSDGEPVATVGALRVWPNASNIVPGSVEMSVDIRDLSDEVIEQILTQFDQQIEKVAAATQSQISIQPKLQLPPVLASTDVQALIAESCQEMDLTYAHLPSRAGHDAQEMGRFTDMGMIFVPSRDGISHSGAEYTSPEQCVQGANVLLQTVLKLDRHYC